MACVCVLTLVRVQSPTATLFEGARLAPLPLAPSQAPCCAMPATCWPHGLSLARGRRAHICRATPN
eukprot:6869369-Prymnesium_polylepis.1